MSLRRFLAPLSILLLLFAVPAALATGGGYGNDPCDEYHETRHPECQTTTTEAPSTTTTQPLSTTTTIVATTTTPPPTTTTEQQPTTTVPQTTTTAQECVPPLIHQPPLCVSPTTAAPEVSSTVVPAAAVPVVEELPLTGLSSSVLALGSSLFLTAGLGLLALRRRVEG